MDITAADLLTVGLLVGLEGLLSADNALVMAIMVLGLPKGKHRRALSYGLAGGFIFRIIATLLAAYLIRVGWVKLLGGLYLQYLTYTHFFGHGPDGDRRIAPRAKPWLGLNPFWATVVRVELVNLAFSIDSILVAVAMSPKIWVVMIGGILGIVAMRVVAGQVIVLVQRYPAIVDGVFIIIAWVGVKLGLEYLHDAGHVDLDVPQWFSIALIVVIFAIALAYARTRGPARTADSLTERPDEVLDNQSR